MIYFKNYLYWLKLKISATIEIFRKIRILLVLNKWVFHCGKDIRLYGLPKYTKIGKNLSIYDNVIFEFGFDSKISIGNNCLISYSTLINCNLEISIGDNVLIGEFTSIRDTQHNYQSNTNPIRYQGNTMRAISIGSNVWIGRGCIIMPGCKIPDGCIIGANSFVKGELEKNGIYVGAPAKLLKYRL